MSLAGKILSAAKNRLNGPLPGMQAGVDVHLGRPHRITNPKHIHIGDRTFIHDNAMISPICEYGGQRFNPLVEIGSDVHIGPNLYLACISRVRIGDGTVLSEGVYLNDCNHGMDPVAGHIMKQPLVHGGDVMIGRSCFLGLRSVIMPGVELGDHCVVGIQSVVTRSFPAYCMLWGFPARVICRYDPESGRWI